MCYAFDKSKSKQLSTIGTNVSVSHGPNLTYPGISRSVKGYCGRMKSFFRFHMEIFAEKLLERRMKQMIRLVTNMWFLTQAL